MGSEQWGEDRNFDCACLGVPHFHWLISAPNLPMKFPAARVCARTEFSIIPKHAQCTRHTQESETNPAGSTGPHRCFANFRLAESDSTLRTNFSVRILDAETPVRPRVRYRVLPNCYTLWKRKIDLSTPPFGHPLVRDRFIYWIYYIQIHTFKYEF